MRTEVFISGVALFSSLALVQGERHPRRKAGLEQARSAIP
jgi:hypothetical protein